MRSILEPAGPDILNRFLVNAEYQLQTAAGKNLFLKLKNNRRFATRYEKRLSFLVPSRFLPFIFVSYFDGSKTDFSRGTRERKPSHIGRKKFA